MKVTYVVLSYGKPELLIKCLSSFRKTHPLDPVIVTDNGGPDWEAVQRVGEMYGAKMYRDESNESLSKLMNKGCEMAETDYVCIITNGVVFTERLTEQFEKDFAEDEETVMVGGLLFYPDGRIQHGGGFRRWNDHAMGHLGHGKQLHNARLCEIPAYRLYVTGATAAIRKSFWETNKYDETLTMSCEDTDMCFRAWKAGKRVFYDPRITTIHAEGSTRGKTPEEKMRIAPEACKKEEETTRRFNGKYTDQEIWKMDREVNRLNRVLHPKLPRAFVRHCGLGDVLLALPAYRHFEMTENDHDRGVILITHVPEPFKNENPLHIATEMDTYQVSDFVEMDLAYEFRQHLSIRDAYAEALKEQTGLVLNEFTDWIPKVESTAMDELQVHRQSGHDWTRPYVVVHAKNQPAVKTHPPMFWAEVVQGIKDMGYVVVMMGDATDLYFSDPDVINLTGRTNLGGMHKLMEGSKLFVGVDSGPLHIADGTCPAIGIFTFTDPKKIVSDKVHAVISPVPCVGCHHRRKGPVTDYGCEFEKNDPRHYMCTYVLRSEVVLNKIKEVLNATGNS